MAPKNDVVTARNRLATLYAFGRTPSPEDEAEARRGLTAAKLRKAVDEALAAAPPLTAEQRREIARILSDGAR